MQLRRRRSLPTILVARKMPSRGRRTGLLTPPPCLPAVCWEDHGLRVLLFICRMLAEDPTGVVKGRAG